MITVHGEWDKNAAQNIEMSGTLALKGETSRGFYVFRRFLGQSVELV